MTCGPCRLTIRPAVHHPRPGADLAWLTQSAPFPLAPRGPQNISSALRTLDEIVTKLGWVRMPTMLRCFRGEVWLKLLLRCFWFLFGWV